MTGACDQASDEVRPEDVEDLHARFYAAVEGLWASHAHMHKRYGRHKLQLDRV